MMLREFAFVFIAVGNWFCANWLFKCDVSHRMRSWWRWDSCWRINHNYWHILVFGERCTDYFKLNSCLHGRLKCAFNTNTLKCIFFNSQYPKSINSFIYSCHTTKYRHIQNLTLPQTYNSCFHSIKYWFWVAI